MWARGILPASRCSDLQADSDHVAVQAGDFQSAAVESRTIFTDASGGPQHVHSTVRRAGVGAAAIQLEVDESGTRHLCMVGLLFGTCAGRQTEPRAETAAGHMRLSRADCRLDAWYCEE